MLYLKSKTNTQSYLKYTHVYIYLIHANSLTNNMRLCLLLSKGYTCDSFKILQLTNKFLPVLLEPKAQQLTFPVFDLQDQEGLRLEWAAGF